MYMYIWYIVWRSGSRTSIGTICMSREHLTPGGPPHEFSERKTPNITDRLKKESLFGDIPGISSVKEFPAPPFKEESFSEKTQRVSSELKARVGAFTGSWLAGETVLFGEVRLKPVDEGGKVEMLMPQSHVPTDAKSVAVESENLVQSSSEFTCWRRVEAVYKPVLSANKDDKSADSSAFSIVDLLKEYKKPFARFVINRSVPTTVIDEKLRGLDSANKTSAHLASAKLSQEKQVEFNKQEHADLEVAKETGLWETDIVLGAKTEADLDSLTGRFLKEVSGLGQPYRWEVEREKDHRGVERAKTYTSMEDAIESRKQEKRAKAHCSSNLLAALVPNPETEVPGIRVKKKKMPFAVNPEKRWDEIPQERRAIVGTVLDGDTPAEPFALDSDDFLRHVGIFGTTGSGKSETVQTLALEAAKLGLVVTIIAPAGGEDYRRLGAIFAESDDISEENKKVVYLDVGGKVQDKEKKVSVGLDAFRAPPGYPIMKHINHLLLNFQNAFSGDAESVGIFSSYMQDGIKSAYEDLGYNVALDAFPENPSTPTFLQVLHKTLEKVDKVGYGEREITGNIKGFLRRSIEGLTNGIAGEFFNGYAIDPSRLNKVHTIIDIGSVVQPTDKTLIMGALTLLNQEQVEVDAYKRTEGGQVPLKQVIFYEESHNFLKKMPEGSPGSSIVKVLTDNLAELRKYGIGIVIIDQMPSALDESVLENTNTKIIHTLQLKENTDAVGNAMGLSQEQSMELQGLDLGETLVKVPNSTIVNRVKMADPENRPKTKEMVASPLELVHQREGTKMFTDRERYKAETVLANTSEGRVLTGWADMLVVSQLMGMVGFGDIQPDFDQKTNGKRKDFAYLQKLKPGERECAIHESVTTSVDTRFAQLVNKDDRDEIIDTLSEIMAAHMDGRKPTKSLSWDKVHPAYRYTPFEMELAAYHKGAKEYFQKEVKPYPESEKLTQGEKIPGDNAMGQYVFITEKLKKVSKIDMILAKNMVLLPPLPLDETYGEKVPGENVLDQAKYLKEKKAKASQTIFTPKTEDGKSQKDPAQEALSALETYIQSSFAETGMEEAITETYGQKIPGENLLQQYEHVVQEKKQSESIAEVLEKYITTAVNKDLELLVPPPQMIEKYQERYGHEIEGETVKEVIAFINERKEEVEDSLGHPVDGEEILYPKNRLGKHILDHAIPFSTDEALSGIEYDVRKKLSLSNRQLSEEEIEAQVAAVKERASNELYYGRQDGISLAIRTGQQDMWLHKLDKFLDLFNMSGELRERLTNTYKAALGVNEEN